VSEHTPGPWEIVKAERSQAIGIIAWDSTETVAFIMSEDWEQRQVDAALIAAAPDMLATLLDIEDHLDGERIVAMHETPCTCRVCTYYLPLVRATIAKARGEAPA
jgi:hypothetical protein